MGRPRGFVEVRRVKGAERPVAERTRDYREFEHALPEGDAREQGARCMDCGVPFCHAACPLGNAIPDWNDLVLAGRWSDASAALHATNNFPEVTGRVCPAPCEASCVLALETIPAEGGGGGAVAPGAVTIKAIERAIADHAIAGDALRPQRAAARTGRRVAVVGSGPAGLAAAQQLARRGHDVTVYEKADRVGGLLRYGIPDFKLEKHHVERRVAQMRAEGVAFRTRVDVGAGEVTYASLRASHDALVLCNGAERPRPLGDDVDGRALEGVRYAMDYLAQQNRRVAGDAVPEAEAVLATGKRVVVLGGGDTGSDCVGTAHRQGAASVTSLELMPRPPDARRADNPWPAWPLVYRASSSHAEGGARDFGVQTRRVLGDARGRVRALEAVRVVLDGGALVPVPGSEFEIPCDLLLLAMGFLGPVTERVVAELGVALDRRGNLATDARGATSVPGVFAAGDAARGQSLVVWAIADGRRVADGVDAYLRV